MPLDRRSWMVPLRYYDPDPTYRVPAQLDIADDQPIYDVPTSTGQFRRMQRIGHLEFVLHGESHRLTALLSEEEGLFVPFRDETSREETYPAGRYIDLPFSSTRRLRPRLQPRLPPHLLLRRAVRLPVSAAGEPPPEAHSRRREAAARRRAPAAGLRFRSSRARSARAMSPSGVQNPDTRMAADGPLLGVVFDFDGVIADTERLHLQAYQDVLRDRGMTLSAEDYEARYLGFDDVGVFSTVASDLGFALDRGELERLIEVKGRRYTELVAAGDVVFPDAPECIERLAGDLVLGIASGALHQEIEGHSAGAPGSAGTSRPSSRPTTSSTPSRPPTGMRGRSSC